MIADRWEIRGKTVFITGAAGGIGSELARQLAAAGANLLLVDVDLEGTERVASDLGDRALVRRGDVTDLEDVEVAVEAGLERFGALDVVVANAAVVDVASAEAADLAASTESLG
jgi:NAD(P)-dependent dehydrogenase (short-subunit alcohol dehydrogenase family)